MDKKLKHFFLCLSICLSIGILAPFTLRATARSRAPTSGPVSDQALAGSPARSDGGQAGIDLLTTTLTISESPRLYPLAPSSNRRPPDQPALPLQAAESYPQLNAMTTPREQLELIGSSAGQAVSLTVHIEPIQLHISEKVTPQAWMPLAALITQTISTHTPSSRDIRAASVCVVTSTADSGSGTLRQCLGNAVVGDIITFDAGVFPPASPASISLLSPLPWIITDSLIIDASDAGVILNGSSLSSGAGLVITGTDRVKIRGLQIVHFPADGVAIAGGATNTVIGGDRSTGSGSLGQGNLISGNGRLGIWLQNTGTMSNTVLGNYIGTDASGAAALGNALDGVAIGYGATNNTVGGNTSGTRNLISGNGDAGLWLQNTGTSGNHIVSNYIGTDVSGTVPLGNLGDGVFIGFGASNNVIGGTTPGVGNLISGNGDGGVHLQNPGTTGNQILGNFIGTDGYGTASLGNAESGVTILLGATNNVIGGGTVEARNIISGNKGDAGVEIAGAGAAGNLVFGNYIGTNVFGAAPLANVEHGVVIYDGATNNIVGGATSGARNLISGNGDAGIVIAYAATSGNQVLGNYIGTDTSGTAFIPNNRGVLIYEGPTDNTIGGDSPDARNLVIGNTEMGVRIEGNSTTGNKVAHNVISGNGENGIAIHNATGNEVLGNYIGTDPSGTIPLGNLRSGVVLDEASNNVIGGAIAGAGNLISGNEFSGIHLQGSGTTGNQIQGNLIGTDVSGTVALGNLTNGIIVTSGASDSLIGGNRFTGSSPLGEGNLISGNEEEGISLSGVDITGNQIQGNFIGTDISGTAVLGNLKGGIFIGDGASNNTVGGNTSGVRNLISGNVFDGVRLQDPGTAGNQIQGNFIGTDVSGTEALGNLQVGIALLGGVSNNLIGGATSGEGNLISSNQLSGIYLWGPDTTGNQIQGNFVGTDVSGTEALGNLGAGINLLGGASGNIIGGDRFTGSGPLGQGNLISGNEDCGIVLEDAGTSGNQIQGNLVGTNSTGTAALGNLSHGIAITFGASNNTIGGNASNVRNLISGNQDGGVWLQDPGTTGNHIHGNFIGTDITGSQALGNRLGGVILIRGASNNLIGGGVQGQGNLLSGNEFPGVTLMLAGTSHNRVQGNLIGTDALGTASLGNVGYGVFILDGASNNTVGGETIATGNTIAFNSVYGIYVSGEQTLGNTISHNSIHDHGGLGIETVAGGNAELAPPTIIAVISTTVVGQAGPDHIVELFTDLDAEGQWFESNVIADATGVFTLTYSGLNGSNLAATATDADGNTSEFSDPVPAVISGWRQLFLPITLKHSG